MVSDAYEQVEVTSAAQLRSWLEANHDQRRRASGWSATRRRPASKYLAYDESSARRSAGAGSTARPGQWTSFAPQLLLTPRKPASKWSRPNKIRIAELEASGRMAAPGRAVVEAAKASGTWTALDDVENLVEPAELKAALDATPEARQNWDAFPRSTRRATLEWIAAAKRAGNARAPGRRDRRAWPPRTSAGQPSCQRG